MLSKSEVNEILNDQIARSTYKDDIFNEKNRELKRSYLQEPYGTELEGRSQVVASDHYELTESDMPTFARVFLGPNKIMTFKPYGQDDQEECDQKTKYADYLIRGQKDSFKILFDWLKEPSFSKISVLKFYPDEEETPSYHRYKNMSEDEIVKTNLELEAMVKGGRGSVEIESQTENEDGTFNINFKLIKKTKKITIVNIPSDRFIISDDATCKDEAEITGDIQILRKDRLIGLGYDEETVKKLVPYGYTRRQYDDYLRDQGRYQNDVLLNDNVDYARQWQSEKVKVEYLYPLMDYDEDGRLERRCIVRSNNEILANEPYGIAPYAINSQIPMPNTVIGKSRGEFAAKTQLHKTAIERSISDNIYSVSRPRIAIDDSDGGIEGGKVNIDDLVNHDIEGVIRVDGSPSNHLLPFTTPYIGDSALQIIQYIDAKKVASLGHHQNNQGLDADKFYKETATRFEGVDESGKAKIELVCRVYAEIGFRQLYEGVIWTAQHYQDETTEIMVLDEPLMIDPVTWKYDHYCTCGVGLGAGDSDDMINNLAVQLNTQLQLAQTRPELVDSKKIYNTLEEITRAMGRAEVSRFYNDPEIPIQMLLPALEEAQLMVQQLQSELDQNPLAEAAMIEAEGKAQSSMINAEAKLLEAQNKGQAEAHKFMLEMAQKDEQFRAQMQLDMTKLAMQGDEAAAEMAYKLTKLEVENNTDIPGSIV